MTKGFSKDLEIVGVGYKAEVKGKAVVFSLGYSHPVDFPIPEGIAIALDAKAGKLTVSGADRQKVGQTAAEIRKLRVPDPYKAKGIKYAQRGHPPQGRKGGREVSHEESAKPESNRGAGCACASGEKVRGSAERPRLAVFKSGKHIYAQVIDDATGRDARARLVARRGARRRAARRARTSPRREARRRARRRTREGKGRREGRVRPRRLHLPRQGPRLADAARKGGLEF